MYRTYSSVSTAGFQLERELLLLVMHVTHSLSCAKGERERERHNYVQHRYTKEFPLTTADKVEIQTQTWPRIYLGYRKTCLLHLIVAQSVLNEDHAMSGLGRNWEERERRTAERAGTVVYYYTM